MGAWATVPCRHDEDSPSAPGFKSVLSDSLEEFCTADEFYDGLWSHIRNPFMHFENIFIKERSLVEHGEEEFTVRIIYDGAKLKNFGVTKEEKDICKLHHRIVGNKKELTVVSQNMNIDGELENAGYCKLLKDPLRVEYWLIEDGERKATKLCARILEFAYIRPVLQALAKRKVKCNANHESSLQGGGLSAISEPMDEHLTYEAAFDLLQDVLKNPERPSIPGFPSVKSELKETENGWELTELEPDQFRELALTKDSTLPRKDMHYVGQVNKEDGEIILVVSMGQQLLFTVFIHFHRDPLRIESWQIADGKRQGGVPEATHLQHYVDAIITKSQGTSGYYF
uniref:Uncharacterized protein n=1 Tax=Alexandrium catenella TaxID=2925 RepID=A0A7S1RIU8_ALECA|mmetsp:Transcript_59492/g.159356  ORF Transcript_59492/g.159356 Transcript_59492/m.159356 type:complete len:341 (+) Transcript_59492:60-1082(+)